MATNEFEHVHFAWQARCFMTLQKKMSCIFAGTRATFCVSLRVVDGFFFCVLVSWLWPRFLYLGGAEGGGIITSFRSGPMMVRS